MIEVRTATEADLPSVLELYSQSDFDDGNVLQLDQAREIWQRFSAYPSYKLWVAELDSKIVGTFTLLIMDNLGHLGTPSSIVEDVAVHPEYQSQGIGRLMITVAIEEAKRAGCYKLSLSSNLKRHSAHHFYESLGFQKHGFSYHVATSV